MEAGLSKEAAEDGLESTETDKKLQKGWERRVPDVLVHITSAPAWVANPGGIPQNVLSKLPRLIHVPATADSRAIQSAEKTQIRAERLSLLFEDLVQGNKVAQRFRRTSTSSKSKWTRRTLNLSCSTCSVR